MILFDAQEADRDRSIRADKTRPNRNARDFMMLRHFEAGPVTLAAVCAILAHIGLCAMALT